MASSEKRMVGLPVPFRPRIAPTRALVNTVWVSKPTVVWNVRAMPSRQMLSGCNRWISRPPKRMTPLVSEATPVMESNKVVLPAPFGPAIA